MQVTPIQMKAHMATSIDLQGLPEMNKEQNSFGAETEDLYPQAYNKKESELAEMEEERQLPTECSE